MTTLFWLALVLGGGLAVLSLLGNLLGDVLGFDSHSGGADVHVGGADVHAGSGDVHSGELQNDGLHILSLRSATYFLFAFGAVGVLLDWVWEGQLHWVAGPIAFATGSAAALFSAYLFRWVSRTQSGEMPSDNTLIGLAGEMVLPLARGSGKVQVHRNGREYELLARAFDDDAPDPESWKDVVIIEIRDGTALVSPLDEQTGDSLLPPSTTQES